MRQTVGTVAMSVVLMSSVSGVAAQAPTQTQTDAYTRYELQAPGSERFRIIYDVSATTAGAQAYYNPIREGAEEEVHGVTDLHTGKPLAWELVDGVHAQTNGHPSASAEGRFIKVTLARPVPDDGQGRIRIDKTYQDPDSYRLDGDDIVFERSLGIRRNAVVLPVGYELAGCNHPCQVDTEADGRVRVSFMNPGPGPVPFHVQGTPLPQSARQGHRAAPPPFPEPASATSTVVAGARGEYTLSERAFENRDITYYLQQPETHSFRLFHDYTESRTGADRYLNIVRAGSKVADPSATNLDTGEALNVETLVGTEIEARGIEIGEDVGRDTEVVVIWFDPVESGQSVRLRIWETYTDAGRYVVSGDDFVWDRSFGRARNTVVLPTGWYLRTNAIPAVIDRTEDGRTRLQYVNPRPDQIRVLIRARRR